MYFNNSSISEDDRPKIIRKTYTWNHEAPGNNNYFTTTINIKVEGYIPISVYEIPAYHSNTYQFGLDNEETLRIEVRGPALGPNKSFVVTYIKE